MLMYDYDSNGILVHPMNNRTATEITNAFVFSNERLSRAGLKPRFHKLDNEAPKKVNYKTYRRENRPLISSLHIHRRNPAECAMRTFKNNFIARLCSTYPNFSIQCWCRLIHQAEMTLIILRLSRLNNKIAAYAQVNGAFDYNATPLALPGTQVLVHEAPKERKSWDPCDFDGWYVGPTMKHSRCFRCYIPTTNNE